MLGAFLLPSLSALSVFSIRYQLFEEAGVVAKHDFKGTKARYEEATQEHHDHLIDVNTGEITEFVNEEIEKLQEKVAAKLGYKLVDHRLELYGSKIKK